MYCYPRRDLTHHMSQSIVTTSHCLIARNSLTIMICSLFVNVESSGDVWEWVMVSTVIRTMQSMWGLWGQSSDDSITFQVTYSHLHNCPARSVCLSATKLEFLFCSKRLFSMHNFQVTCSHFHNCPARSNLIQVNY